MSFTVKISKLISTSSLSEAELERPTLQQVVAHQSPLPEAVRAILEDAADSEKKVEHKMIKW